MQVFPVSEGHCAVPSIRLPKLLNPASTSVKPKTKKEFEEDVEAAEFDTGEAEIDAQAGADWESPDDESFEAADEELEADAADHERDEDSESGDDEFET